MAIYMTVVAFLYHLPATQPPYLAHLRLTTFATLSFAAIDMMVVNDVVHGLVVIWHWFLLSSLVYTTLYSIATGM